MTDRYFPNNYPDYTGETYVNSHNQLIPGISSNITHWIEHHTRRLERHVNPMESSDMSVYTGNTGVALLYLRLAMIFPSEKDTYKSKAKVIIDAALQRLRGKRISFLNGDPGPLAIAAVIYNDLGDQKMVQQCINKIISMKDDVLSNSNPDEYLYGRSGYLYALVYLRKEIRPDIIDNQFVTDIFESIIKSGENYARKTSSKAPLMYEWHEKEYMGAAHGVSGIIFLLLKVAHDDSLGNLRSYIDSHLIPTVEFLTTKRLPSGNYLSSTGSDADKLVQWCHGAPGFVYLFARTYEITGNVKYLELAIAAGNVVWERGLLRKGYGLCHGVAGNGYVFLALYRISNDTKWLHRAIKFSEHCLDYGKHDISRTPDHPYSLFEGLTGTIYFMADILHPVSARFPAYEY